MSTVPEQGAEMEVSLLAPCRAKATCHCPQSVAFWRQKEQKVVFSGTPLCSAHPPTSSMWRCQTPAAWKAPQTWGGRVFPMRISSLVGETCVLPLPGRGAVAAEARRVQEVQTTPLGYALVSVGLASVSLSLR